MPVRYRVVVVMDPLCGEDLRRLSKEVHVWAIRSPENERVARSIWSGLSPGPRISARLESGITVFDPQPLGPGLLDTVIEHHGAWSHDPPVDAIEVCGAVLDDAAKQALLRHGFRGFSPRADGFLASRQET